MNKIEIKIKNKKKQQSQKIVDCRKNGKITACNDFNKVLLKVKQLNCYILVDKEKINTPKKKEAYIRQYIEKVEDSRKLAYNTF